MSVLAVTIDDDNDNLMPDVVVRKVQRSALVVTRNDMADASYSNDPNQEKLMYAAMVVVRKTELEQKRDFDPNNLIAISARNFGEITHQLAANSEISQEPLTAKQWQQIERTAEKALWRVYNEFTPMIMRVKGSGSVPAKVPMITYCLYDKDTKSIYIRFAPEFYQYFYRVIAQHDNDIKTLGYYSHEIRHITRMDSYYSIRIYRMLMEAKWRANELTKTLDDLKWSLDCTDKYKNLDGFKRRVLDPAIAEINQKSNLDVEYENIKRGRTVIGIKFMFDYKDGHYLKKFNEKLDRLKKMVLKTGAPYNDDGSHFKDPERDKYVKRIESFTSKQIGFLVSCPQFLNDYSAFYAATTCADDGAGSTKLAKEVLAALLKNKPDVLQDYKLIDFDYYIFCQCKNGILRITDSTKKTTDSPSEIITAIDQMDDLKD